MKQVINHIKGGGLLNMIRRTDPMIFYAVGTTVNQEPTLTVMPNVGGNYEDYSVQYGYDPNSNISSVYRQGRLSTGYDTVEDDDVERDGNQLKAYDTSSVGLPYYNNMDFKDGANAGVEYSYDANGSLTRDDNKGITYEYDLLGHLKLVTTSPTGNSYKKIEYVYAPDGRCLRKIQKAYWHPSPHANLCLSSDTIDFYDQYIVKNRVVEEFHFDGGYCSMSNGTVGSCHFYLQDYQGNNRMVVNAVTDSIEQVTHYYPYGGLMADICTGHDFQPYKYGGKQLDRYGGLDLYDFHARQLDPLLPGFTSIDPHAEDYYSISPYAYCGGDPVNAIDNNGERIIFVNGYHNIFFALTNSGPSKGGQNYWATNFVTHAQRFFNDYSYYDFRNFVDGSSLVGFDQSGKDRYDIGIKYAENNYKDLIFNLAKDEPLNIVTHSEGAAFGAGIAYYLLSKGINVNKIVHLSADEGDEFTTPESPFTIQFSYDGDWITGNHYIEGTDIQVIDKQFTSLRDRIIFSHGQTNYFDVFDRIWEAIYSTNSFNYIQYQLYSK